MDKATWIWYPGDYEVWLGNVMNNRRTERGAFFPPFWKQDSHYVTVEFSKHIELEEDETVALAVEGKYNVKIDGRMLFGMPREITIPKGSHNVNVKVWNQSTPPCIYLKGKTVKSDGSWHVTNEDKEWIDESGKASDTSASVYVDAGSWCFDDIDSRPSEFRMPRLSMEAAESHPVGKGVLYDFGKETFGYLVFDNPQGFGCIDVYYGESAEEALDKERCETLDRFKVGCGMTDLTSGAQLEVKEKIHITEWTKYIAPNNKAFRYVYVETEDNVTLDSVGMMYEYMPEKQRGTFRCNDHLVNSMWRIGEYTLHLTTREFFIDGIKRDRWTWSGDAYQSYLMNYYLYFDSECVKRTTWQLRGKDPVTAHINTIMDYTFFWFLGVYDYYMYTGDSHFVRQIYPRMKTMMDYVLGRTNNDGMVEGMAGDWVFVDWADGPMSKKGALAFEQVLLCKSLETMAMCAELAGEAEDRELYELKGADLRKKLQDTFWDDTLKALVHNVEDGKRSRQVTKYANMFAIFFDYLSEAQKQEVLHSVMHNKDVMPITTPYMRFYELEALCAMGEQEDVLKEMKDYWGGMIELGATTFWEKYNPELNVEGRSPEENFKAQLPMYGRPYGKSLCHAWGASPIYLLGKYFLGVKPLKPGYEEFEIRPVLGGLEWMEGTVPMPEGNIHVYMDRHHIGVIADKGNGWLYLPGMEPVRITEGEHVALEF